MNISILAAGSGGMYCGSCMRDNTLASALRRRGHRVTLVPLYTPLRSDAPSDAVDQIFYGGVNVYLQHFSKLFQYTPRAVHWLLDRPWLLNVAGRIGAQTDPAKLADFAIDVIKGEEGPALLELRRLVEFMRTDVKPQVVSLPNLMFIGVAPVFRRELKVPVVVELTGEDIFLDAMKPEDRLRVRDIIRRYVPEVDRFVATSRFYAGKMAEYLGIDRSKIDVVYPGIAADYLTDPPRARRADGTRGGSTTIGYLARMCPEKGIDQLLEAFLQLRQMDGMRDVRLRAAGYVGKRDADFYDGVRARASSAGLNGQVSLQGEVDRDDKLELLDAVDVFSAPTAYAETKGIFVLEAWARGLPVVQPSHGAFPELIEAAGGGGVLVPPGDSKALSEALAALLHDPDRRRTLGEQGREAVRRQFTDDAMADRMVEVYEGVVK